MATIAQPGLFDDSRRCGEALEVAIDLLADDPAYPRTDRAPDALDELARDIAERGVLQPIVVAPADEQGRYRIRFGGQRWRAARRAGLATVPVVVRSRACDGYDQVAENLKRHALSPLELARFIQSRFHAGESNAFIARRLAIDATTIAHHLTLLELSPDLAAAMASGRCTSPRTLHELQLLHAQEPQAVAGLLAGAQPLTRNAVAAARTRVRPGSLSPPQLLDRSRALCDRLDRVLAQLVGADPGQLPAGQLAALRDRSLRWRSGWQGEAMASPARDRVTVDLRGLGERLRVQAAAQRLSAGALVRRAIVAQLESTAAPAPSATPDDSGPVVKITLRLSAPHAVLLATRARRADVSQGAYVAGLIDGTPPAPQPPDHAQAVAALVRSTDQLAALSADVNGFVRLVGRVPQDRLEPFRKSLMSLTDDVRKHLQMAAALLTDLRAARPGPKKR